MQTLRSCRAPAFQKAGSRTVRTSHVCSAMKLYSNPASRGRIIEWYLKELDATDCEIVNMDMKEKREHKSDWFKKVNPFGKVPALEDGDVKLFESGAILLYLADKYGKTPTPAARAAASKWTLFANATLATAVFVEQFRERQMPDVMGTLDALLGTQPYLEGQEFTVADVAVGSYLLYIPAFFPALDLSPYPNVLKYMDRLVDRPACGATVGARAKEAAAANKK